jgi:hypothetical protein
MVKGLSGKSPANISLHLKGIDFPAQKQDLVQHANKNGAPSEVLDVIKQMPDDEFENMADVMKAYGEVERDEKRA